MEFFRLFRFRGVTSIKYSSNVQICQPFRPASNFKRPQMQHIPKDNLITDFKQVCYENNADVSQHSWRNLRAKLIAEFRHINKYNVDALIIGQCSTIEDLSIAKSYIRFLQSEGIEPNFATLGKYLRLFNIVHTTKGITPEDEQEILNIYTKIRKNHEVMDATTCENLIHGLLATKLWRESLFLLEMTKLSAVPSISSYNALAAKAFTEGELELGWELLKEMIESKRQPKCSTYIAYIKAVAKDAQTFATNLKLLFRLLGQHEILISQFVVSELRRCLEAEGHMSKLTKLCGNGKCTSCNTFMQKILISSEEFEKLSSNFLNKVLVRNDIFQKSTPEEVNKFINFVERNGPFDCVIDGLNVAYSCGVKKSPHLYGHLLSSVVKYFHQQKKFVLVLGRQHMRNWPADQMNYIKRNAMLFFTNDLSQDDPFLLYATLKSGESADFFSRDLMRSHAFLLGSEMKLIFRRWQQQHQYSLVSATDTGKVVIKEPIPYVKYAQGDNARWHIPYKENYSPNPPELIEVPDSWLCIKFNK